MEECCAEQESLGLIAGSRVDLWCISGIFFLTVFTRKQDYRLGDFTGKPHGVPILMTSVTR